MFNFIVNVRKKNEEVRKSADIKLFLLKKLLLTIILCYILGPLHQHVIGVMHTFSHTIFPHESDEFDNVVKDLFLSAHNHSHDDDSSTHEHDLIELMEQFFSSNPLNDSEDDAFILNTKIDKHITPYEISYELTEFIDICKHNFGIVMVSYGVDKVPLLDPPEMKFST